VVRAWRQPEIPAPGFDSRSASSVCFLPRRCRRMRPTRCQSVLPRYWAASPGARCGRPRCHGCFCRYAFPCSCPGLASP
jgi:hypothetical protein